MKTKPSRFITPLRLALVCASMLAFRGLAQYATTWSGTSGDFVDPANWSSGVPTNSNPLGIGYPNPATFAIANGGMATINVNGDIFFNYFDLGDTGTGFGNLVISNGIVHMAEYIGDSYSQVGLNNASTSSLVMWGGTNYIDGPQSDVVLAESGITKVGELWKQGSLNSGVNSLNWFIGNLTGSANGTIGHLELHGNSLMRVARTLNFADAAPTTSAQFQVGSLVMDGNAEFSCGDGMSMGKDFSTVTVDLSGNAKLVVGASNGIGNNTNGCSQQGFLTLGARETGHPSLTVRDNAEVHCMTLQNRAAASILLTNNAKLLVYNVLAGSGTLLYPYRDSYLGLQNATSGPTVMTVSGNALFSVDTTGFYGATYSNVVNGLSLGNGQYTKIGGSTPASGYGAKLIVKDHGTFRVMQGLHLGTSATASNAGILSVVGPDATVNIGDQLRLGINFQNAKVAGLGEIEAVLTGPIQSTIYVTNQAMLTNGALKVTLQGYTPVGGESYTLISAGSVDGLPKTNDLSAAVLAPGLVWKVSATPTALLLQVSNTFAIKPSGPNLVVSWQNQGWTNILQSSTGVAIGYTDVVPTASSPYTVYPTNAAEFFRLRH